MRTGESTGNDTAWVIVLAGKQVLDHRFQVGVLIVRFAPDAAGFEIIGHQIYGVIMLIWYDRRRTF
jgi:hypothetical protein